ncbi:unnamed protein product [Caenorhabditis brenneri]
MKKYSDTSPLCEGWTHPVQAQEDLTTQIVLRIFCFKIPVKIAKSICSNCRKSKNG